MIFLHITMSLTGCYRGLGPGSHDVRPCHSKWTNNGDFLSVNDGGSGEINEIDEGGSGGGIEDVGAMLQAECIDSANRTATFRCNTDGMCVHRINPFLKNQRTLRLEVSKHVALTDDAFAHASLRICVRAPRIVMLRRQRRQTLGQSTPPKQPNSYFSTATTISSVS